MLYDKDIREPLFDYLEETWGRVRILEEKRIGKSRADVVMVTEAEIIGIEIKSDADTYARLAEQVRDYDRFCDRNIVVVGSSHAVHIEEHIPQWWGIITVDEVEGRPDFYLLKRPKQNPGCTMQMKIRFLWRPELVRILEKNHLPKYKDKSKLFVGEKIAEKVEAEILNGQISEELFERDYNTIAETINAFRVSEGQRPRRKKRRRSFLSK